MKLITLTQISQMVGRRSWNTGIIQPAISILPMVMNGKITMLQCWFSRVRNPQPHFAPIYKKSDGIGYDRIFQNDRTFKTYGEHDATRHNSEKMPPTELGNNFGFLVKADQFVHKTVLSIYGSVYHETRLEREQ